ncbi:MAG: hypothetical protein ABIO44_08830 [Saprospiraceae bacterium]
MKIRIQGQSIRFRLSKFDISQLEKEHSLYQKTDFGNTSSQSFSYQIIIVESEQLDIDYIDNKINLNIPLSIALEWFNTEKVGFDFHQSISPKDSLYILIEKDFQCLVPRAHEDESGNYNNPLATIKK